MSKEFIFIKEKSKLDEMIDSIAKRGKALDQDVHQAGCSAILHFKEHGDNTFMTKLVNAMSRGMRKNSLIQWFETYGGVVWEGKGEEAKFVKNRSKTAKIDLETAIETPYYEGKAKEGEEWNARKNLARVIQIVDSAKKKATEHNSPALAKKYDAALGLLTA
jgi:hypothetical protein